jgi:hypothetical protein
MFHMTIKPIVLNTFSSKSIYLWLYSPFRCTLDAFSFLNRIRSWWDTLDGGSARRKGATYTQNNTDIE